MFTDAVKIDSYFSESRSHVEQRLDNTRGFVWSLFGGMPMSPTVVFSAFFNKKRATNAAGVSIAQVTDQQKTISMKK